MNKKAEGGALFGIGAVVFILVAIILLCGFDYVPAGNTGVKDHLGTVADVPLSPGVYWTGVFTSTKTFSTRIQLKEYDASAASMDLQPVYTTVALNFKINPSTAPEIYKTIGFDYQDVIITPVIQEAVKSSTAMYTAENLVKERPVVKNDITNYIISKLEDKGLVVTEVSITDFEFSDEFNAAIERKQVAEQDAKTAQNKLEEMTYTAEAMELQSKVIEIKKLDIQQAWINKWDGKMPTTVVTSDSGADFLMQIPTN
ncbi:MAG: prohibitin family protein [Candidatus Thorarchaeota archaeon]